VQWRAARGLSQAAVAAWLHVSQTTVYRWETGSRAISPLAALALEHYDCTHNGRTR
jgi:DNA-binding transcriptional regulator YiaG